MSQIKEEDKTPEQLSEVEISHLPEKELRIAVAKDLGKTMEKM